MCVFKDFGSLEETTKLSSVSVALSHPLSHFLFVLENAIGSLFTSAGFQQPMLDFVEKVRYSSALSFIVLCCCCRVRVPIDTDLSNLIFK